MVVVLAWLGVYPVALEHGGANAVYASLVAALLCLAAGELALLVSEWLSGPDKALIALGASMAIRMGLPLFGGLLIHLQAGSLARAGLIYYLAGFYLLTLTAETLLAVGRLQASPRHAMAVPSTITPTHAKATS